MKKTNQKGFTLIELLVVIAIIGLLSTLAVVSLNSARGKARDARRMSDLKQISTAMELYASDDNVGNYPTAGAGACVAGAADRVSTAQVVGALETMCAGEGMSITNGTDVYLATIPGDPAGGAGYAYEGTATTYCIHADLETDNPGAWFLCVSGSCFPAANPCNAI